jgi:hypothetical protein
MAKKKAAKKKAAKKKAAKKKSTKKKTAKKKTAKKAAAGGSVTITFKCSGGCKATARNAHMGQGDYVDLVAKNTDATIDFVDDSPFDPPEMHIEVAAGTTVTKKVAEYADIGEYEYVLSCGSCRSPVSNPKMIVP